jgi:predicted molibdopterin-dependent oxidoreductase YjgC
MAWSAASDEEETELEHIGLLVVVGDEAAASPSVRALAERADAVIAVTMFHALAVGWADLVLPATAMLERDGTLLNLEGRLQRLRRATIAPVPDELAWISKLAARFGVELSPHAAVVFDEVSEHCFSGIPAAEIGDRAPLAAPVPYEAPEPATTTSHVKVAAPAGEHFIGNLRLLRYRPLFSGPQVERVDELRFQRPDAEAELSPVDAEKRRIANGDEIEIRSNGTSLALRARLNRALVPGVVRIAEEHAGDLHAAVEVLKR